MPKTSPSTIQGHYLWRWGFCLCALLAASLGSPQLVAEAAQDFPRYKPASRAPSAIDIRTNQYGASRSAPNALEIGDVVVDFSAPKVGGGLVSLRKLRKQGDVVIVFYRGHW